MTSVGSRREKKIRPVTRKSLAEWIATFLNVLLLPVHPHFRPTRVDPRTLVHARWSTHHAHARRQALPSVSGLSSKVGLLGRLASGWVANTTFALTNRNERTHTQKSEGG